MVSCNFYHQLAKRVAFVPNNVEKGYCHEHLVFSIVLSITLLTKQNAWEKVHYMYVVNSIIVISQLLTLGSIYDNHMSQKLSNISS